MRLPPHWTDLDKALFLLDGAEQSIVDEFHAPPDSNALALLDKHAERRDQLRREAAEWNHPSVKNREAVWYDRFIRLKEYYKRLEADRDSFRRTLDDLYAQAGVEDLADMELIILAGVVHRERCR